MTRACPLGPYHVADIRGGGDRGYLVNHDALPWSSGVADLKCGKQC